MIINPESILIVSDIDGTFLGNRSRIVDRNIEAIKRFIAKGGLFTFATGRVYANIPRVIPMCREITNAPAIMANGTYLYDFNENKMIHQIYMDDELISAVLEYVRDNYPNAGIRVSDESGFLVEKLDGYIAKDMSTVMADGFILKPMAEWPKGKWLKAVIRGNAEYLDGIRDDIAKKFGDILECSKSNPRFLEYQHKGCSKATTMLYLKEYYKSQGRDLTVIAAGDFENDYEMLKNADIAVCPDNALDSIKAISKHCLSHCDKGLIADIIEYIEKGII